MKRWLQRLGLGGATPRQPHPRDLLVDARALLDDVAPIPGAAITLQDVDDVLDQWELQVAADLLATYAGEALEPSSVPAGFWPLVEAAGAILDVPIDR